MSRHLLVLAAVCLLGGTAYAQDNAALLERLRAMEERIKALEAEVTELKGPNAAAPAQVQAQAPVQAPVPIPAVLAPVGGPNNTAASQAAASKVFNPDIAVIGDFVGIGGQNPLQHSPSFELHESELALQAVVDPYARADFFISFGETGVTVEEGFITFPALPGHLELKAGKMRAAFGKINTLHNHVLPWVDRPLVTQSLVGGEDGIDDAGVSLSRILPAPGGLFLEATGQVYRGDSDDVFHAWRANNLSTVGHVHGYRDISESTNADVGFSYARGASTAGPGLFNNLYDIDATVRWKPLRRSIYHSFTGRGEFVWSRNEGAINGTPFGFFVSGDYQFARRWFTGLRFDQTDRPFNADLRDTGGAATLTYWPSEFSQVRGEYRKVQFGEGLTANEFLFQLIFSIGAHGAHPF